jgi:hypothetical protein
LDSLEISNHTLRLDFPCDIGCPNQARRIAAMLRMAAVLHIIMTIE